MYDNLKHKCKNCVALMDLANDDQRTTGNFIMCTQAVDSSEGRK